MHLVILFVIDLIKESLPVVIEIKEKFLVLDHLGLSVKKHSSGLSEMFS